MRVLRSFRLGVHPSGWPSIAPVSPPWVGPHGALSAGGLLQQVRATDDVGGDPIRLDRRVVRNLCSVEQGAGAVPRVPGAGSGALVIRALLGRHVRGRI